MANRDLELYIVDFFCEPYVNQTILSLKPPPQVLDVFLDPLNRRLECTLFASLYFGITQIATNSKSMRAPFKVFPLVSWCEPSENLIGFSRCLEWELCINSARVDEERNF